MSSVGLSDSEGGLSAFGQNQLVLSLIDKQICIISSTMRHTTRRILSSNNTHSYLLYVLNVQIPRFSIKCIDQWTLAQAPIFMVAKVHKSNNRSAARGPS